MFFLAAGDLKRLLEDFSLHGFLAEQALATATSSLRQTVQTGIPKLIERAVPDVGACRTDEASGDG